jgi:hypothetical protein
VTTTLKRLSIKHDGVTSNLKALRYLGVFADRAQKELGW